MKHTPGEEPAVCEVMELIADYCIRNNIEAINELPGAFGRQIDDNWYIAVNGKDTKQEAGPENGMRKELKQFEWAVWWNGWIAGFGSPFEGIIAAGELANMDTFRETLK